MQISTSYCLEGEREAERGAVCLFLTGLQLSLCCVGQAGGRRVWTQALGELEAGQEGGSPSSSQCLGQTLEIW